MAAIRISEAVVDAAIRKAVEAGVFPRRSTEFEAAINREVMSEILRAALSAATQESEPDGDYLPPCHARPDRNQDTRGLY